MALLNCLLGSLFGLLRAAVGIGIARGHGKGRSPLVSGSSDEMDSFKISFKCLYNFIHTSQLKYIELT